MDKLIKNFIIIPFAKLKRDGTIEIEEGPVAVAHSEYHIYFLYSDCITVVSKITSNIVHTEYIYDTINCMYFDQTRNCLFMHSSKNLYQLVIENEGRDVWRAFLEKEDYEQALNHCKNKNLVMHAKKVSKMYAANLFERGEFINAAYKYGDSDEKFEEVALKFLVKNQTESLKIYLMLIDKQLASTCITQKTLLASWLCEIYLHELNNTNNTTSFKNLRDKFKVFMNEKLEFLDKETIYQLMHNYGRTQEYLEFAELKCDYETVILYYVNEKNFQKAIEKLHSFIKVDKSKGLSKSEKSETEETLYSIFCKYSHVFMKYQPEMTIELLLKNFKNTFDPNKIISAIMNTEESKKEKVAEYLEELISGKIKDKNVHNLYLFFLSQINSESSIKKLLFYLEASAEEKVINFEVDYALKVFSQFKIFSAQAWGLAIMGKYEEGVKIALENNYPEIAKKIANIIKDDDKLKKHLWLEVFKQQMKDESERVKKLSTDTGDNAEKSNESNFNFALKLMEESGVLKIEDVLPNLMGNIKIEVFKTEITKCIDGYENSIETLKNKIYAYNETAKNVKNDIVAVKKKCLKMRYQQCICEVCNKNIKEDDIYVFPCGHMFDSECLFNQIKNYSNFLPNMQDKVEKLMIRKNEIDTLEKRKMESKIYAYDEKDEKGTFFNFIGFGATETPKPKPNAVKRITISNDELKNLEALKKEFIDILTEECVLCGDLMIDSIKEPFFSTNTRESWMII